MSLCIAPKQPLIGTRQAVFWKAADHLEQRRADVVVKIFRRQLFLPRLGEPGANLACEIVGGIACSRGNKHGTAPLNQWLTQRNPRTRIGNAPGTSYEMCAEAYKPRCAPMPPFMTKCLPSKKSAEYPR